MSSSKKNVDERLDKALRTLTGSTLQEAILRNMTGTDMMHVQESASDDVRVLGCMYPAGSAEFAMEAEADEILAEIAKAEEAINEADRNGTVNMIRAKATSPADVVASTRAMVDACEGARSVEELADAVSRFSGAYPEIKARAEKIAYERGWLTEAMAAEYKRSVAAVV